MKRHTWFLGLLVAALVLAGCMSGEVVEPSDLVKASPDVDAPSKEKQQVVPASKMILMDGELVSMSPSLGLSFPGSASGELLSLKVRVGQRVQAGQLVATLDDRELQEAVDNAQLVLDRAIEDRDKGKADEEETYQTQLEEARERYEDELRQAEQALDNAKAALARAQAQPPTTAVAEAQANLDSALDMEAQAHDEYKKALDRPWEPQSIRDSLYKEWQQRIQDRALAELRLQDAEISLQIHYLDLEAKKEDVTRAEEDLARVEMDEVKREENLAYDRAVEDAERTLAEAQQALDDASLTAPWDGLVTSIDANAGAEVTSGTTIVTVINLEHLVFVTSNLSERHIAQLRPGQIANVTLRTYPDITLRGEVESIVPQSQSAGGTEAHFAAHIRLDETELDLLPGMTGRVEVTTDED